MVSRGFRRRWLVSGQRPEGANSHRCAHDFGHVEVLSFADAPVCQVARQRVSGTAVATCVAQGVSTNVEDWGSAERFVLSATRVLSSTKISLVFFD